MDQWCGGSADVLESFWQGMKGTSLYERAKRMGVRKTVPLKLFGDGVAVTGVSKSWGKSVDAFLMSSLVSTGSSKTNEVGLSDLKWGWFGVSIPSWRMFRVLHLARASHLEDSYVLDQVWSMFLSFLYSFCIVCFFIPNTS